MGARGTGAGRVRGPRLSRRPTPARRPRLAWWHWLGLWCLVGLVVRVCAVLGRPDRKAAGDNYFYHWAANLLVEGKGFINPFTYNATHHSVASASFPPGFVFVLAAAALVGLKSYYAQRMWCAVIGAVAVGACGLAGREIAGKRAGLIAAAVAAVYPNLWMSDEAAMSETLSPLLVAVVLLTAYRFWKAPTLKRGVWLGLAIGAAAITRDELSLLGLLILIPVILTAKSLSWKQRGGFLAAGVAAAVLVVGPWVGYNLSRFKDPTFISTGLGITLASTNCNLTYYGRLEGYWNIACASAAPVNPKADESVQGAEAQSYAEHYIRTHEDRLVPVVAARLGRAFGLFHPIQQIQLDALIESRPYHWALVGLFMYYVLAVLSVGGVVVLRRRKVPLYPLAAVGLTVVASVVLTFGDTRYRSTFEVVLAILAATALDRVWAAARSRWGADRVLDPGAGPAPRPADTVGATAKG